MQKEPPNWFGKPYGNYGSAWDDAITECRRAAIAWARRGQPGFYSDLVPLVPSLAWPNGAFTNNGSQMGKLLGDLSVAEWLKDRPLLSAVVVQKENGVPGKGFFDLARQLGVLIGTGEYDELGFWSKEFQRCCDQPWSD